MTRKSWHMLNMAERQVELEKVAQSIKNRDTAKFSPKEWRELAYEHSIPENTIRSVYDPKRQREGETTPRTYLGIGRRPLSH